MVVLKSHNNRYKNALEILRFVCQQLVILSERRANGSFYGLFVNSKGKIDSNFLADLQMEHLVKLTKCHIEFACK